MVEIHRTCRIKLNISDDGQEPLHQTNELFQYCANRTADWAWRDDDYCVTSEEKANNALYDELRRETDELHSNLVQKAIKRGVKAVDSGVERTKNGKKKKPANPRSLRGALCMINEVPRSKMTMPR
jgi:putative transposase